MDRGALWTPVHRVANRQTRWNDWACLALYEYVCLWVGMYMRVSMCLCVCLALCMCVCVCVIRCISLCAPVEADVSWGWVHGMQGVARSKNRTIKKFTVQKAHVRSGHQSKALQEENARFQSKTCLSFSCCDICCNHSPGSSATWSVWFFSSRGSESRCGLSSELLS